MSISRQELRDKEITEDLRRVWACFASMFSMSYLLVEFMMKYLQGRYVSLIYPPNSSQGTFICRYQQLKDEGRAQTIKKMACRLDLAQDYVFTLQLYRMRARLPGNCPQLAELKQLFMHVEYWICYYTREQTLLSIHNNSLWGRVDGVIWAHGHC